jgi:hypothetical protein
MEAGIEITHEQDTDKAVVKKARDNLVSAPQTPVYSGRHTGA